MIEIVIEVFGPRKRKGGLAIGTWRCEGFDDLSTKQGIWDKSWSMDNVSWIENNAASSK